MIIIHSLEELGGGAQKKTGRLQRAGAGRFSPAAEALSAER